MRVAVVDWDLEAPGIECFFLSASADRARVRQAPGLLDLVALYRQLHSDLPPEFHEAATGEQGIAEQVSILRGSLPPLSSVVLDIATRAAHGRTWRTAVLDAPGIRDENNQQDYVRDVQTFDWGQFYSDYEGGAFFAWLREEFNSAFDVTLIDSRTGLTEVGGICTREMADFVACFCAPNAQNLEGCALMVASLFADNLQAARQGRALDATLRQRRERPAQGL